MAYAYLAARQIVRPTGDDDSPTITSQGGRTYGRNTDSRSGSRFAGARCVSRDRPFRCGRTPMLRAGPRFGPALGAASSQAGRREGGIAQLQREQAAEIATGRSSAVLVPRGRGLQARAEGKTTRPEAHAGRRRPGDSPRSTFDGNGSTRCARCWRSAVETRQPALALQGIRGVAACGARPLRGFTVGEGGRKLPATPQLREVFRETRWRSLRARPGRVEVQEPGISCRPSIRDTSCTMLSCAGAGFPCCPGASWLGDPARNAGRMRLASSTRGQEGRRSEGLAKAVELLTKAAVAG